MLGDLGNRCAIGNEHFYFLNLFGGYRTTNKTYGRDYYTEKARVELFKKIDEDYESIVRLSNAHFVE